MTAQRTTPKGKTLSAPAALAETPMDMFSTVYRACASHGLSPLDVDEMEVWQVASALGVDMDDDDDTTGAASAGAPAPGSLSRGRAARMRARSN